MTLKESQLKELLGHLVREVMNELGTMGTTDPTMGSAATDPTQTTSLIQPPTPAEKAKQDRQQRTSIDQQIKQTKIQQKSLFSKMKADKEMLDKEKRIDKPNTQNQLRALQKQKVGL